mmetsp:Transcript_6815/g.15638  ORF Transcript_6815/g.15638 Transcript_6815/m.15638 type:complete len:277 (+) Transcript_6815:318-1148(+)
MPAVATRLEAARVKKEPAPCITPSPTKTRPFMSWRTAPRMDGTRAAATTAGSGLKTPRSGRHASWAAPSPTPASPPHANSRLAVARAASPASTAEGSTGLAAAAGAPEAASGLGAAGVALGLALGPAFPSSAGTRTEAQLERPKSTTPPSCQSWIVMAWAAANIPVASNPCVVRVMARKAALSARARSWTAAPPCSSGLRRVMDGGRTTLPSLSTPSRPRRYKYAKPARHSATAVAMDAPATPRPHLKMRIGSRTTFTSCVTSVILSGVIGSSLPR